MNKKYHLSIPHTIIIFLGGNCIKQNITIRTDSECWWKFQNINQFSFLWGVSSLTYTFLAQGEWHCDLFVKFLDRPTHVVIAYEFMLSTYQNCLNMAIFTINLI